MIDSIKDWLWWNCPIVFTVFIIGVLIFTTFLAIKGRMEEKKCCARFEEKIVHQDEWTQVVLVGKTAQTIYHPAGDYERNVCVEVKEECIGKD